jgi:hypothetical protein
MLASCSSVQVGWSQLASKQVPITRQQSAMCIRTCMWPVWSGGGGPAPATTLCRGDAGQRTGFVIWLVEESGATSGRTVARCWLVL